MSRVLDRFQLRYTFGSSALVGAVCALIGGAIASVGGTLAGIGGETALLWAATAVAGVHHAFLLNTSTVTAGRIVGPLAWLASAIALYMLTDNQLAHLAYWIVTTYLLTAALHHRHIVPMLALAALTLLGMAGFAWAFNVTGSIAAGLWCFFLVLATATLRTDVKQASEHTRTDGFDAVARTAEAALSQVSARSTDPLEMSGTQGEIR